MKVVHEGGPWTQSRWWSMDWGSALCICPDFDMDENLIHKVDSDYYVVITFPKTVKTKDCFSLFHVNLRSLSAHIDEMQALLTALTLRLPRILVPTSDTKGKGVGLTPQVSHDSLDLEA